MMRKTYQGEVTKNGMVLCTEYIKKGFGSKEMNKMTKNALTRNSNGNKI